MKKLLFKWCECSAYLSKVKDGTHIERIEGKYAEDHQDHFLLINGSEDREEVEWPESPCEGAYDLEKTYYIRREHCFSGVVVGFRQVKTEGYLGVDTDCLPNGAETRRIFKEAKTLVDCAIVFFASGQKRFVPLDAITPPAEGHKRCSFGGVSIKPNGVNELDPCVYRRKELHRNVTVEVSQCERCGNINISWYRQEDTVDEIDEPIE